LLCGCGGEENTLDSAQPESLVPENFQDANETWTRSEELTDKDQSVLEEYFRKNPSFVEGALVKGDPSIFLNEKDHRRFYWIGQPATGTRWFMVEIKNRKIGQHESQGLPFP
jgi:hypothetical protein